MFWDPHHLCGGKGQERARGVTGSEVSKRGVRGGKKELGEQEEARGARQMLC